MYENRAATIYEDSGSLEYEIQILAMRGSESLFCKNEYFNMGHLRYYQIAGSLKKKFFRIKKRLRANKDESNFTDTRHIVKVSCGESDAIQYEIIDYLVNG